MFSEEFEEIQEEFYSINPATYDIISNCYECISSGDYTDSTEILEDSETEDDYWKNWNFKNKKILITMLV